MVTSARSDAEELLTQMKLNIQWAGEGDVVIGQGTPPGTVVAENSVIQVLLGSGSTTGSVVVPDVRGMNLREAIATISRIGLRAEISGSGLITTQVPAKGKSVSVGSVLQLKAEAGDNA